METLVQQFIKAFGWSIVNSLWQSAIIYGVLFIVMLSIPKMPAKYKHNLAFASIVLMFGTFAYNFANQTMLSMQKKTVVVNPQNIQLNQYFNHLPQSFASKAEQYFPIIVAFYIIGIFLQLFIILKGYHQLSKYKTEQLSNIPADWAAIFNQVAQKLGIKKMIQFHLSAIINVPLVIGYLKPVVLFPIALVNQLDNEQVEAILIHELSHVRRNDFLLNLVKTAIETLLFFNPFVWMAGRFIHIEREHACDDLVLKVTGKPLNYAHALLKLELLKDKNSPAYALAATGKSQNLYQRIKRITNMKTNYLNTKQQMAALTLGIACLFSIAWINPATNKKGSKKINKLETIVLKHTSANTNTIICQDTSKKRKVKIVTIDANGRRTEYNSVKDMPDSLRKDFYRDEVFGGKNVYRLNIDSPFLFKDSLFKAKIQRLYTSPEAKLKWKKFGEDLDKEYNSPENQAKWKKFGEDIAKEYNSPEAQAKWKKFGDDIAKEFGSPEAKEKWKKMGEEMTAKLNTPEFRAEIDALKARVKSRRLEGKRITGLSKLTRDSLNNNYHFEYSEPNGTRLFLTEDNNSSVKQSEEYKKLKEKFDKEVKALKEKMEQKENRDRTKN